jgi:hypothetical protein
VAIPSGPGGRCRTAGDGREDELLREFAAAAGDAATVAARRDTALADLDQRRQAAAAADAGWARS